MTENTPPQTQEELEISERNRRFSSLHVKVLMEFEKGRRLYRLNRPFMFIRDDGSQIVVPAGFVTDMLTIPRWAQFLFPRDGRYMEASIIHDYYYTNAIGTKEEADHIFKEALKCLKSRSITTWIFYHACKFFGKGNYNKQDKHIQ